MGQRNILITGKNLTNKKLNTWAGNVSNLFNDNCLIELWEFLLKPYKVQKAYRNVARISIE